MNKNKFLAIGALILFSNVSFANNLDDYLKRISERDSASYQVADLPEKTKIISKDYQTVKNIYKESGLLLDDNGSIYLATNNGQVLDGIAFTNSTGNIYLSPNVIEMNEKYRHFIIAHELAHVSLKHIDKLNRYIKDLVHAINPEDTMSELVVKLNLPLINKYKKQQEIEADLLASKVMYKLGYSYTDIESFFDTFVDNTDTPATNHPTSEIRKNKIKNNG